jgi:hypothetical protein
MSIQMSDSAGSTPWMAGIATDGGVLRRQVTQEFCGPANQSGLQQVLLFGKTGFVQALGVALIPVETPAQKQALGRPRDLFGCHDIAALAPQVGAVAQDPQPGKAAPGGMTDQDAGQPQSQLSRQQEGRWLRHHASGGECGNGRRTQFVGGPQQGFERIGHGLTLLLPLRAGGPAPD